MTLIKGTLIGFMIGGIASLIVGGIIAGAAAPVQESGAVFIISAFLRTLIAVFD